jgi:ArsR family transcriptional regulator, arsenate/arsenite/antimonite-responsive transcriptional repressor
MKENTSQMSRVFKALSDVNRLKILLYINEKKCKCDDLSCTSHACLKDISQNMQISLPTISHHIKELINAGLVRTQKKGRWVYCMVVEDAFKEIASFIKEFKE